MAPQKLVQYDEEKAFSPLKVQSAAAGKEPSVVTVAVAADANGKKSKAKPFMKTRTKRNLCIGLTGLVLVVALVAIVASIVVNKFDLVKAKEETLDMQVNSYADDGKLQSGFAEIFGTNLMSVNVTVAEGTFDVDIYTGDLNGYAVSVTDTRSKDLMKSNLLDLIEQGDLRLSSGMEIVQIKILGSDDQWEEYSVCKFGRKGSDCGSCLDGYVESDDGTCQQPSMTSSPDMPDLPPVDGTTSAPETTDPPLTTAAPKTTTAAPVTTTAAPATTTAAPVTTTAAPETTTAAPATTTAAPATTTAAPATTTAPVVTDPVPTSTVMPTIVP